MKTLTTRRIVMKRGELFQIARNMMQVPAAKSEHAERFRRICSIIRSENQKLLKPHAKEVEAAKEAIPLDQRTDEKFREVAMQVAEQPVAFRVDIQDLKVFVKAFMTAYQSPMIDAQGHPVSGQGFANLQLLHEDLVALGIWDAWHIGDKLIVDPEDNPLDKEFPSDALELDDESLDDLGSDDASGSGDGADAA